MIRRTTLALLLATSLTAGAQAKAPLTLSRTISLPGITGKFDHLAVDLAGHRLFAAATGNHSVEVVDLATGKVLQSIGGLGKPHGLVWAADNLYIADGTRAELLCYHGTPLKQIATLPLSDDADDMVLDEAAHTLYVGHGTGTAQVPGAIAVVDIRTFRLVDSVRVAAHPEALDIDPAGHRVFANIADKSEIAVLDTTTHKLTTTWKLTMAQQNVPMAFDSSTRLLYVACRTPGSLLTVETSTGKELSKVATGEGADDLFLDAARRQVYVISGAGAVDVYDVSSPGHPVSDGAVETASGAKTALFVPELGSLFLAVPGIGGSNAQVRVYQPTKAASR